jgi:hypothetical protein
MSNFNWKGFIIPNQLRCRLLMNRILGQCEYVPIPILPEFLKVPSKTILKDLINTNTILETSIKTEIQTNERENMCVLVEDFKYNKFRLLIILPSNYKYCSECFTLDLKTGIFYACKPIQLQPNTKIYYGYVFSVILNENTFTVFPKNEDIKIIDVFAAEGSIYNKESISERLYFLKKLGLQNEIDQKKTYQTVQTKRLPFDVLYPNLCPETSIKNLRRYELLTPLPTFKDLKGQQIKTY